MGIANKILERQDRDGMLRRSLERIIQLYTDKSHFVYELLQNAEDAGASSIRFIQYENRLEVMHDGHAFTTENLQGLCDIGQSDKVNDLNQIGEFGVGFKSVFGICDTVRLYSNPEEKDIAENCHPFAVEIQDFTRPVDIPMVDVPSKYTTLFVFPYSVGFQFSGFKDIKSLNAAITKRLKNLGISALLFMKNLSLIEYDVLIPGQQAVGQYMLEEKRINDHCTRISAIEAEGKKPEEMVSYIKFSMPVQGAACNRTIDIAFQEEQDENGNYRFRKAKDPYISVYFPTETESKLDFIVQGPFRTTPNRSSVPADDEENIALAKQACTLLRRSVLELRDMGRLDLSLIKILPLDEDKFRIYNLFDPVYDETRRILGTEKVLPTNSGGKYIDASHALIARSKELTDLLPGELVSSLYNKNKKYDWMPISLTETGPYKEVLAYCSGTLGIEVLRPEDLRTLFNDNPHFLLERGNEWLVRLYRMYETIPNVFSEKNYRNILDAKIIKTAAQNIVAPYRKVEGSYIPNVFLPRKGMDAEGVETVHPFLYERCRDFFEKVLHLKAPDEYEFFIKSLKKRYGSTHVNVVQEEYIGDFKKVVQYLQSSEYKSDMQNAIKDDFLVRCNHGKKTLWVRPNGAKILFPQSESGIAIEWYYKNVADDQLYIDYDYYQSAGITFADLRLLGCSDSILTGEDKTWGEYYTGRQGRQPEWTTYGSFRWELSIDHIEDVLMYIESHPAAKDSLVKSQVIFRILQENEEKLFGDVHIGGSMIEDKEDESAEILKILNKTGYNYKLVTWSGKWVYTTSNQLVSHTEISKYELNPSLYGALKPTSDLYDLLGFKKGVLDQVEAATKDYVSIPEDRRKLYFAIELQQKYGITPEQLDELYNAQGSTLTVRQQQDDEYDFPSGPVKNWDALKKHAAQILSYANPVRYERVVRSIRISRPQDDIRAYLMNMYRVGNSYRYACQLCHEPSSSIESCQLERKPEIELEPLNLCLCPSCARDFKTFRNDPTKAQKLLDTMMEYTERDIDSFDHVSIVVSGYDFWFTQTHIAEIIELLKLRKQADFERKKNPTQSAITMPTYGKEQEKQRESDSKMEGSESSENFGEPEEEELQSDAVVYKEYVGKRVYHKTQKAHAVISECDGVYFTLVFEDGPKAGKTVNYSMAMCIDNGWLEIVE